MRARRGWFEFRDVPIADDDELARIDAAVAHWRQGDCVLGEQWFIHRFVQRVPLSEAAADAADQGAGEYAETAVVGLMVSTQTCDLVRPCRERPFVEVTPIVQVDEEVLRGIRRGYRPRYAYLAALAERLFVADLDRSMTVEKSALAEWTRVPGCLDDSDVRHLSAALARKRARFAFPDDFIEVVDRFRRRALEKHDANSPEGQALRALREIRVRASPSWDAAAVELEFVFIPETTLGDYGVWSPMLLKWQKLLIPAGRYTRVDVLVQSLDDITARFYVESDPLDLDHLSERR